MIKILLAKTTHPGRDCLNYGVIANIFIIGKTYGYLFHLSFKKSHFATIIADSLKKILKMRKF